MDSISNTPAFLKDFLQSHDELIYTFRGVSMMPMLRQEKDLYVIKDKGEHRLKKYDVALYKKTGQNEDYILHRIVQVTEDGYIFLGDNCVSKEIVKEDQVIGVMTAFYRGPGGLFSDRTISVENTGYKAFSRLMVFLYPGRKVYRKGRSIAARCYHHLIKA